MLRPLGGGNMNPTGGLSSIGMNMNNPNNNLGSGGGMVGMSGMSSGGVGGGGMSMPMNNLPMSGVTNVNSGVSGMGSMTSRLVSPRHAVHIIWDIEHVGVPSGASEVWVINSLVALAERECQGYVESFVACCHEGYLDLKTKRELQDSGVAIEEVHSRRPTDNYILTRLLALSLQLSLHRSASSPNNAMPSLLQLAGTSSSYNNTSAAARPILIMITGERDLARALHIIRQSSIFQEIVLLHPPMHDSGEVLRQAATQAVEWLSFLSLNQMALQQQQQQSQPGSGGRLTPMSNMMAPTPPLSLPSLPSSSSSSCMTMTTNTPPGIATRSRPPGGPGSSTNTPETRYRGMSGDQSSSQSPALTPSSGAAGVDENRPMGGRGDWHAWQDKTDKLRVQQQSAGGGTPTTTNRKSESDNWRTPATPTSTTSGSGNNHDLPPPPYRTPYQREMARRLHPSTAATPSTGSPGSSPLASPPSPGDVRVSDERDRERERDRDHYYDQQHRVTTAADYLREKEAAAWEQGSSGGSAGGGRSRSSSTASVSGRLISLDEQHSQHSGTTSGGHSTPTSGSSSGSGTPTGQGQGASYAQVLGKTGGGTGSSMTTTTITPRTGTSGSSSAPSTPQAGNRTPGGTITASAGSSTPGASARGRPDRATLAVRLFGHVMNVCAEEKIIPRESVIRSKLEDTSVWDSTKKDQQQAPPGLKSWQSLHMEFEAWLDLVQQKKACVCVGVSPQRVLWPCPPQARFECADYFRPQERLNAGEMTQLVEFLANDQHRSGDHASQHHQGGGQVDRGRYGFANYLKSCGPPFVRDMPRGYVVELVQLLLNKNFLQFRKGKVSFRSTAAGRWKRALESVQASGIGGTPSLDNDDNTNDDESSNAALMDQHDALMSSTATATPSSSLSSNKSGSGIGSNNESVLITSTRPGAKGSSTSLLTTSGSTSTSSSGGKPVGSTSPYPPARAPSSSPDSSSESSSQALRRANILAQRNTTNSSGNVETRPRAATLPSDSKSGSGKLIARGTTPPLTGAAPVGPSLDFDDPVELLAVKCAEAPSPILSPSTMALILKREHLVTDGVRQAFFPLYHFEKSGEQHAPLWVCVITLDLRYPIGRTPVGTLATSSLVAPSISQFPPISNNGIPAVAQRPKRFRSTRKAKKLEAQQEAAMRAIESGYWTEAFQPPVAEGSKPVHPPVVDYVANIIDDPVVILDRLLITLEQAPAVYSMESAITQHGSGSRTMWTCGVQLALRPRPAHLTTGTISMEQAENGEMPSTTSDDAPSVRYPTIKFQASQAKKFDAKGQVASHVLGVLEKSRHRYPMLFQATPEPLPPRPKTLLMPSMIGTSSSTSGSNTSGSITTSGIPQSSAPSPPPQLQPSSIIVSQGPPPKPPSPVVLPQRTARERSNAVSHGGSQSNSGSSSSSSGASSSGSDNASAVATYHAAQARAHKLLLEQQAQQQHQHQQMLQQQQAQHYGGMSAMAPVVPVITMMPHPPPMPPSYVPIPISSPPSLPSYGVNNNNNNNNGSNVSGSGSGRSQALRATANEWQPASLSSTTTGSSGNVISSSSSSAGSESPPSSSSLPSTSTQSTSSTSSTMMPTPPSSSPPRPSATGSPSSSSSGGTFGDRLQRIPMIRTFLSNLTSPSSSAPSGGRYLTPSHVVASENSGVPSIPSSSVAPSSSTTNQSSNAPSSSSMSGGQVPGAINVNVPNKSPSGSPLSGIRAITPPGQNLRAYVSPMGRTRPVSESALGLGGIQWEHQSSSQQSQQQLQQQPQSSSQSPIPIGGTGKDNSGTSSGSNSARMAPRRLAEHDDDNMRALRRSVDDLLRDQPSSKASNNNDTSDNNNNKNVNDGNKNTNSSNDNMKPISNNNATNNNSNDRINIKAADKSDNTGSSSMMKTNTNINTNDNDNSMMKNNKNESRALKIPSPVSSEPMITSPSSAASSSSSMSAKESACPLPGASQDQHDQHACHAM